MKMLGISCYIAFLENTGKKSIHIWCRCDFFFPKYFGFEGWVNLRLWKAGSRGLTVTPRTQI
jgi:hypothetical protein